MVESHRFAGTFAVMTVGFFVLVPVVVGYLAVRPVPRPSRAFRAFAPWVPCVVVVLAAWAIGWEGAVCIVMALPVMLLFSSLGGILGGVRTGRAYGALPALVALPWVLMPLEAGRTPARRIVETTTAITVDAPPEVVWPLVVSVDSIRVAERRPALFTTIGFPEPVAATLSRPGVGGVRTATFEGGVVFRETVTDWEEGRRLRFTIDPEAVPAGTLDPHVTIGGPYFDVLTGTYELRALPGGRTRLVLRSEHRVSTAFNVYAAWWADRVMGSIQRNILAVLRDRAERRAPAGAVAGVA